MPAYSFFTRTSPSLGDGVRRSVQYSKTSGWPVRSTDMPLIVRGMNLPDDIDLVGKSAVEAWWIGLEVICARTRECLAMDVSRRNRFGGRAEKERNEASMCLRY